MDTTENTTDQTDQRAEREARRLSKAMATALTFLSQEGEEARARLNEWNAHFDHERRLALAYLDGRSPYRSSSATTTTVRAMLNRGYIEKERTEGPHDGDSSNATRTYYRLTERGRTVAQAYLRLPVREWKI